MEKYYGLIALVIYIVCLVVFLRYEAKHADEEEIKENTKSALRVNASPLNVNDEDALVASLVAAIECRNEFKKNVQIVSVRKVN